MTATDSQTADVEARLARLKARRSPAPGEPVPSDARPARANNRPRADLDAVTTPRRRVAALTRLAVAWTTSLAMLAGAALYATRANRPSRTPPPADPRGMVVLPSARVVIGAHSPVTGDLAARVVALPTYAVDLEPVRASDYEAFLADHPRVPQPGSWTGRIAPAAVAAEPVDGVGFAAAASYCSAVGKRLPSELEWEAAAESGALHRPPNGPAEWVGEPAVATPPHFAVQRGGTRAGRTVPASSRAVVAADDPAGAGFRCAADRVAATYAADLTKAQPGWPVTNGVDTSTGFVAGQGYALAVGRSGATAQALLGLDVADGAAETRVQLTRDSDPGVEYGLVLHAGDLGAFAFVLVPARSQWRLLAVTRRASA